MKLAADISIIASLWVAWMVWHRYGDTIDRAIDALLLLADPAMDFTPAGAWRMAGALQRANALQRRTHR